MKEKLGQGLPSNKAKISSVEENFETFGQPHVGNSKKSTPKRKKEDVGEDLLANYALKKGRYVGTRSSTHSMQENNPSTRQNKSLARIQS